MKPGAHPPSGWACLHGLVGGVRSEVAAQAWHNAHGIRSLQ